MPVRWIEAPSKVAANKLELNYYPNYKTKLVMDVNMPEETYTPLFSQSGRNMGVTATSSNPVFAHYFRMTTTSNASYYWGTNYNVGSGNSTYANRKVRLTFDKGFATYIYYANGTTITKDFRGTDSSLEWISTYKLCLFCLQPNNGNITYGKGKIYTCQISEDDVTLFNCIPSKRLSDGACGLYDIVNGNFVGSASYISEYITPTRTLTNCSATMVSSTKTGTTTKVVIGETWQCKFKPTTPSDTSLKNVFTEFTLMVDGVDHTSDMATYDSTNDEWTVSILVHWNTTIAITATATSVIVFEDANVKSICVTNWGNRTVPNEVTPAETAAVTSLDNKFKNNTIINRFNEFKYFTGIDHLNNIFNGCTNLTEVTFPSAYLDS